MRKSRLEQYEELMGALVDRYLSVDTLAFACNMDCVAVNQRLGFLIKNGLVEEKKCHNKKLFALTKRGLSINRTLAITRRLEKLRPMVKIVDDALMAFQGFGDQTKETRKHRSGNENY
jgi:predicted transcriptional regulator